MKYKGAEITEMTPDQWDGKSREMLCWHVEPKYDDSDAFFKEVIVGYYNNHWHSSLGYTYAHCAEIPETVQQTVNLDECIKYAEETFAAYTTCPNSKSAIVAYSTKMYLEDLKLKGCRIDTAIRLIQNDQAFMAMDVLKGEDDSLLDTNPLKDYPPEDLDEQGYRKCFNNETEKLRCSLFHVLSEVFWLKYEAMPDYEVTHVSGRRKSFKHRKDMLFRKYLTYRDAYKKAKTKLKD